MKLAVIVLLVLITAKPAIADPDRGYAGAHGLFGGGPGEGRIHGALALEGGLRIARSRLWARVVSAYGQSDVFASHNDYSDRLLVRTAAGLELRGCADKTMCGLVGLDAGHLWLRAPERDMPELDRHHAFGGAHLGLDGGGTRIRFRLNLNLVCYSCAQQSCLGADLMLGFVVRM